MAAVGITEYGCHTQRLQDKQKSLKRLKVTLARPGLNCKCEQGSMIRYTARSWEDKLRRKRAGRCPGGWRRNMSGAEQVLGHRPHLLHQEQVLSFFKWAP
jgi:hypothetical protein